ncbi:MAG TPA: tRNA (N6-threonylcarbamoyladenosine(37)-N6)-methyltransferase TrmO [Cyanobacteria bacterium UBA8156]|nr:tRNA (N6-threonylcarbamoyladenosine(37)-N6)-methyltransferase TrmO [Cyanobacteria bacterium UBA8156]
MPRLPPKNYTQQVDFPETVVLRPIGVARTPYQERHGTPRQAILGTEAPDYQPAAAYIELLPAVVPPQALQDLAGFSHIWAIAWLHLNRDWKPTVILPRGPRQPRGTLATRAPHRPNPLGLSALRLERIEGLRLYVQGIDLLDGTPILDIKPYVRYCDAFPDARCGYVETLAQDREEDIL